MNWTKFLRWLLALKNLRFCNNIAIELKSISHDNFHQQIILPDFWKDETVLIFNLAQNVNWVISHLRLWQTELGSFII